MPSSKKPQKSPAGPSKPGPDKKVEVQDQKPQKSPAGPSKLDPAKKVEVQDPLEVMGENTGPPEVWRALKLFCEDERVKQNGPHSYLEKYFKLQIKDISKIKDLARTDLTKLPKDSSDTTDTLAAIVMDYLHSESNPICPENAWKAAGGITSKTVQDRMNKSQARRLAQLIRSLKTTLCVNGSLQPDRVEKFATGLTATLTRPSEDQEEIAKKVLIQLFNTCDYVFKNVQAIPVTLKN